MKIRMYGRYCKKNKRPSATTIFIIYYQTIYSLKHIVRGIGTINE